MLSKINIEGEKKYFLTDVNSNMGKLSSYFDICRRQNTNNKNHHKLIQE